MTTYRLDDFTPDEQAMLGVAVKAQEMAMMRYLDKFRLPGVIRANHYLRTISDTAKAKTEFLAEIEKTVREVSHTDLLLGSLRNCEPYKALLDDNPKLADALRQLTETMENSVHEVVWDYALQRVPVRSRPH